MKRIYYYLAAFAAMTVVLTSCEGEKNAPVKNLRETEVGFVLAGNKTITKSAEAVAPLSIDLKVEDVAGLRIVESVSNLDDLYAGAVQTKATPAFTENVGPLYQKFSAVGYQNGQVYLQDAEFVFDSSDNLWKHDYSDVPTINWKDGVYYFMRMPNTSCTSYDASTGAMTFSYTSPATAAEQKDILFASKNMTDKKDNEVTFYHALTAVKFATGNALSDNVIVTNIKFSGLKNSGTCTITPSAGTSACAAWTLGETTADFSQDFDGTITDFTADNSNFGDSFYSAATENNLNDAAATKTFFFIPQSTEGVKMIITYTVNGHEYVNEVDLGAALNNVEWKAGELRTYTLTEYELGISVSDKVENGTKSDVIIENTANLAEYVRAMVVANWVNDEGNVVAPCALEFRALASGWVKASDGFYYNVNALEKGAKFENPFFDEYTPAGAPAGAHLVMDIAVQAIDAAAGSDYKAAWLKAAGVSL